MQPNDMDDVPKLGPDKVLEALEDYQGRTLAVLETHAGDPKGAVEGLVELHLRWVEEDPDRARMVIAGRDALANGPLGERLAQSNREMFDSMRSWLASQVESERLGNASFTLLHAIVFAPTHEVTRHWLGGRLPRPLADYETALKAAAWAGISSLPG